MFYILYYAKNQYLNIMQFMTAYFTYADNITKCMIENFYYMSFLIIYKTV